MDSLFKWLSPSFPVMQIVFCRSFFALLPIGVMVARAGGLPILRTRRLGDHAVRSLVGVASLVCFVYAFGHMPLAEAVAIGYAAPIFITALSVPLLGEPVGVRRWSAVCVGFLGVLVMIRPGVGMFEASAFVALLATLFYAVAMIFIRRLGRTESTASIAFYFTLTCAVVSAPFLPVQWVTPDLPQATALVAVGLIGGIAQLAITAAFRAAPAAVVAPFDYSSMLYVTVIGYVVWGEMPDRLIFAGAAVVIVSGLYILHRERVRQAG
jgi:drug/metabolite transporter (DMT)-like permease